MITFISLFSSSSANASYLATEEGAYLIDCGMSSKQILESLQMAGLPSKTLKGIFVTHEHSDHIRGVGALSRKLSLPVIASEGTWEGMEKTIGAIAPNNRVVFGKGESYFTNKMEVVPFTIPHDAQEPTGFRFMIGKNSISIATDMGYYSSNVHNAIEGSDIVLLESNYDEDLLANNPKYPYSVKKRIKGKKGHLSNEACAEAAIKLCQSGTSHLLLGHLSAENNTEEIAYNVTQTALQSVDMLDRVTLHIAKRMNTTHGYQLQY